MGHPEGKILAIDFSLNRLNTIKNWFKLLEVTPGGLPLNPKF